MIKERTVGSVMTVLLLLILSVNAHAQLKIIESSDKRAPEWIGSTEKGYLIVSAECPTLEEAKQKCLASVKVQMLESVANNIEYSTETILSQVTHNEDVSSDITFRQEGRSSVANLPYISGVSLAKADASYWAKSYNKKTGETVCVYHLRYRFGPAELDELRTQFEKQDAEMVSVVDRYENKVETEVTSVEDIDRIVGELEVAKNYFFDKMRKTRAENVYKVYNALYKKIGVEHQLGNGFAVVSLRVGKIILSSQAAPELSSSCASRLKAKRQSDGSYLVTFSTEDCIPDDANVIEVAFRVKGKRIKHRIEL